MLGPISTAHHALLPRRGLLVLDLLLGRSEAHQLLAFPLQAFLIPRRGLLVPERLLGRSEVHQLLAFTLKALLLPLEILVS